MRLNDKTVTLTGGEQPWRVAYGLLHRAADGDASPDAPLAPDTMYTSIEQASDE